MEQMTILSLQMGLDRPKLSLMVSRMMTTTKSEAFPKALKADKLLTKTRIKAENRKGNNLRFKCLRLELHIKILPMVFKLNS